jgi:hypothetical protein
MKTMKRVQNLVLGISLLFCGAILWSGCQSTTTSPSNTTAAYDTTDISGYLFKPTATVYGKKMAEWSVTWWMWANGTPATSSSGQIANPLLDTTGALANLGAYSGTDVFFIGGKFTNVRSSGVIRTITIPHNDLIFFPVAATLEDPISAGTMNPAAMQDSLAYFIGHVADMNIVLDNTIIFTAANHNLYRVKSGQFSYNLPDNNIYQYLGKTAPAGTESPAFADGFYVMLAPLTPGKHVLKYNYITARQSQQVTYNITAN